MADFVTYKTDQIHISITLNISKNGSNVWTRIKI